MNRVFDLVAVGCLAVVVLMPRASVEARPALSADATYTARVATLEDSLARDPKNETAAAELAELYLQLEHPDWALIVLASFPQQNTTARIQLARATAHAERLEAPAALAAIKEGQSTCAKSACPPLVVARLSVIGAPMQALVDEKVDPQLDPQKAKAIVGRVLHSTTPSVGKQESK